MDPLTPVVDVAMLAAAAVVALAAVRSDATVPGNTITVKREGATIEVIAGTPLDGPYVYYGDDSSMVVTYATVTAAQPTFEPDIPEKVVHLTPLSYTGSL